MMKTAQQQPQPQIRVVTDEVNLITVFLLVAFFAIKITLFALMWKRFYEKIVELQRDIRSLVVGSNQIGNQMSGIREKILRAEAMFKNVEARLDHHLMQGNGIDEKPD
jgi:hypothetical protein